MATPNTEKARERASMALLARETRRQRWASTASRKAPLKGAQESRRNGSRLRLLFSRCELQMNRRHGLGTNGLQKPRWSIAIVALIGYVEEYLFCPSQTDIK